MRIWTPTSCCAWPSPSLSRSSVKPPSSSASQPDSNTRTCHEGLPPVCAIDSCITTSPSTSTSSGPRSPTFSQPCSENWAIGRPTVSSAFHLGHQVGVPHPRTKQTFLTMGSLLGVCPGDLVGQKHTPWTKPARFGGLSGRKITLRSGWTVHTRFRSRSPQGGGGSNPPLALPLLANDFGLTIEAGIGHRLATGRTVPARVRTPASSVTPRFGGARTCQGFANPRKPWKPGLGVDAEHWSGLLAQRPADQ